MARQAENGRAEEISGAESESENDAVCAPFAPPVDPLERALQLAAQAGRFDVVAKLADELHARRLEHAQVPVIARRAK